MPRISPTTSTNIQYRPCRPYSSDIVIVSAIACMLLLSQLDCRCKLGVVSDSKGFLFYIILLAMCKPPEAMHALQALLLSHPRKMTRDTATYPPLMMSVGKGQKAKSRSLRHLAETELGLSIQAGEHSPIDDARSTLYLYHKHRKVCACSFCLDQLHCKEPSVHNAPANGAVSRAHQHCPQVVSVVLFSYCYFKFTCSCKQINSHQQTDLAPNNEDSKKTAYCTSSPLHILCSC